MEKESIKKQMNKSLEHLNNELSSLQIGKASTSLIDNINIYIPERGVSQTVNQVSNTSVLDSQTIKIQTRDKSLMPHIEKAIIDSGIGLNPINQGEYIIISIPPLTSERRDELKKYVQKMGENTKISIRNIRQDNLRDIKKQYEEKEISEDGKKQYEEELDKLTKDFTNAIDENVQIKQDEISNT